MIDIHTHILPGIDDGAANWEQSLLLARAAVNEGITDVIATPHHANGRYWNTADTVRNLTGQLNERLRVEDIPLHVHAGLEIRTHKELLVNLEKGELLTLAGTSYILLEMPFGGIPDYMKELIHELCLLGLKPVIAHPERNRMVAGSPQRLRELIDQGAYTQVTAQSLLGEFGSGSKKAAWSLCQQGMIHLVSSDAHDIKRRSFGLNKAYAIIAEKFGVDAAAVYKTNAVKLLQNESLLDTIQLKGKPSVMWKKVGKWLQKEE